MRCPHCDRDSNGNVLESRPAGGKVWRRRMCKLCHIVYVSCETAEREMRMPAETQSKNRRLKPLDELKNQLDWRKS